MALCLVYHSVRSPGSLNPQVTARARIWPRRALHESTARDTDRITYWITTVTPLPTGCPSYWALTTAPIDHTRDVLLITTRELRKLSNGFVSLLRGDDDDNDEHADDDTSPIVHWHSCGLETNTGRLYTSVLYKCPHQLLGTMYKLHI